MTDKQSEVSTMEEMSTDLQQILRSLCLNTDWKYAVFWKLKHRARMMLTWEDAYYDHCEQNSHDPLGLAVAKMSYHVYSLGEGIVGQVAVTGKYKWIFADNHVGNSCSSFEFRDGWQSQFSAGIKTIVVVAVVPQGVVQLGSLNKVTEDEKLVTHVRDVFYALQDPLVGHVKNLVQQSMKSSVSLSNLPAKTLASEVTDSLWSSAHPKKTVEVACKPAGMEISMSESEEGANLLQPGGKVVNMKCENQVEMNFISSGFYEGETSGWKDLTVRSGHSLNLHSNNSITNDISLCDFALEAEKLKVDRTCFASAILDSAVCDPVKMDGSESYQDGMPSVAKSSNLKFQKDSEECKSLSKLSQLDSANLAFKYSAGWELLEALGPAFQKQSNYVDWEIDKAESVTFTEMTEGMNSSQLTFESGSENLLEAVVANICHSSSDVKSERSFCKSMQSLLTTDEMAESSGYTKHTIDSAGCPINQSHFIDGDMQQHSSEICGGLPSRGYSSTCPSSCSEPLDMSSERAKNSRKRARPGENSRPRPRDRQLIQDRIKELRELVPNGSKCSIDSLLERTIKHILFLQSITKHADELSKCSELKMHQRGTGSSSYEQGSTWAVEVGSHLKVCSIIVENLNKTGQMLVQMLCEECSHFLEIAEAIKSLGLTILKGVTEAHGEKDMDMFYGLRGKTTK
ncbi:transcription factor bHLH155 isoform X1 [Carica papaya]|uniref:transcription factor bHLH155 isoform X1 n=1 Tax=Carica papaya TaxID=3649 RepID=UPI000B8C8E9E|nr:transcription factor bHLH155 isoform X1 [Carica papaya]